MLLDLAREVGIDERGENSRRHGYLLSMLGIRQIVVAVNKIDLVAYDQRIFDLIVDEYREQLRTCARSLAVADNDVVKPFLPDEASAAMVAEFTNGICRLRVLIMCR